MTPIAPLITAFLRQRLPIERQASVHTCDAYAHTFRLLFEFASAQQKVSPSALSLEQIDAQLILAFLEYLEAHRGNGARTRNARLAAIKSFMRFVQYRVPSALDQVRSVMAIPGKRTDSRLIAYLTRAEIQAVLDSPDPRTRYGIRDRAMFHVACAGGVRVSELIGLRLDDLTFDPQLTIRVHGKGRRERALPLWKETASALRAWLAIRGAALVPEVFLNSRSKQFTRSGFTHILGNHVRRAARLCPSLATKRVSPHVLRHTCAMLTLQATHDVRKVALWLGHTSLQTTEIYLRTDPEAKLEAIEAVTPLGLRRGRFRPPDRLIALLRSGEIMRSSVAGPPNQSSAPSSGSS
jgi:integrase/recombinase XerD